MSKFVLRKLIVDEACGRKLKIHRVCQGGCLVEGLECRV